MCIIVSKRNPILPTRTSFFISGVGKCAGLLNNVFPAAASPRKCQLYKSHMATHSSFCLLRKVKKTDLTFSSQLSDEIAM